MTLRNNKMSSSLPNWLLVIVLVAASSIALTAAETFCSDFEDDVSANVWVNTGIRDWYWSGSATPVLIPDDFLPVTTSAYMWFQVQELDPSTGTIVSTPSTGITIYENDEVSISIYRYIINYDGSYRPVLSFSSNGGTYKQNILWTFDENVWSTVSLICVSTEESCCLTYPCMGYFSVDGYILELDEFLAIDDVQINDGCSIAPPPPSPSTWCCDFDTSDVCLWSPYYSSNGWHWSGFYPPTMYVPPNPTASFYVFEEGISAKLSSADIDVPYDAQFTIEYYFETSTYSANSYLSFYFQDGGGAITLFLDVNTNTSVWISGLFSSPTPLCGTSLCTGQFVVESHNLPGNEQIATVDTFRVVGATC